MVNYLLAKNLAKLAIAQDNYIQLLEGKILTFEGDKSYPARMKLQKKIEYFKYLVDWKGLYVKKT